MRTDRPPVYPLVIDPNPEDARRFLEALENETAPSAVSTASSGDEALEFLRACEEDPGCVRPNLVVLEVDLPEMDWRTLLDRLGTELDCADVPVLVFTGRDDDETVARSYARRANAYVRKPTDRDAFVDAVRALEAFWFDAVWLPPRDEPGEK